MTKTTRRLALAAALLALAGTASAHTGHAMHGFFSGLEHPFGPDHLLAMVAVGLWSAAALNGARRWLGPLAFLAAMTLGAAAGAAGWAVPLVETGIAASVLLMGVMLVFARQLPPASGLALIALSAALHGLAHGGELPVQSRFAPYAAGFLLTTAALQLGGLGLGLRLDRAHRWAWHVAGALLGGAGLVLLAQV